MVIAVTEATSIQLNDDLARRVEQLASILDRPRAWIVEQAVELYVEAEARQTQAIAEALDTYRSGNATVYPHEQVMREMRAKVRAKHSPG